MKKHIVMIVDYYYPEESPTSKVAEAYINLVDEAKVDVICLQRFNQPREYTYQGKQVYAAKDGYTYLREQLQQQKLLRPVAPLVKLYNSIHMKFVHPRVYYAFAKTALQRLEEINSREKIDYVFSVSAPMAGHVAALNYCAQHPEAKWIACTLDSYTAQNKLTRRRASCFDFESSVLAQADCVLLSEELYASMQELYQNFREKCKPLPYLMPPIDQSKQAGELFPKDKLNLVYAGRFYKKIRNPEYLLQLAAALDDRYVLHLFWKRGCVSMVHKYAKQLEGKIIIHDFVSAEKIQSVYNAADILISLGNNLPEYKPSKTFEYIASGKPILSIYYPGLRDDILDKYPLALQINRTTDLQEACTAVNAFVERVGKQVVDKETIEGLYQDHTKEKIKELLNQVFA